MEIPPKRPFCIFKMIFCQLKTVVNLLLFRFWICLRLLTRSIMTSCSVDWLSGLALMVWCCSGFDPTWPVVLSLLRLMVYCLLRNCYCAVFRKALCWVHFFLLLYTTPLSSIITAFGLKHHKYTHLLCRYIAQSLFFVQNCMLEIQVWMNQNILKLNPSKTVFMIISNLTQRKKVAHIFPVELLNQNFAEIRNLGVAFDPAFSFKKHVSNICRSAFYHIRDLRRIRIHLNKATAISLANALVNSRLDYCNSLLFGCSEK